MAIKTKKVFSYSLNGVSMEFSFDTSSFGYHKQNILDYITLLQEAFEEAQEYLKELENLCLIYSETVKSEKHD